MPKTPEQTIHQLRRILEKMNAKNDDAFKMEKWKERLRTVIVADTDTTQGFIDLLTSGALNKNQQKGKFFPKDKALYLLYRYFTGLVTVEELASDEKTTRQGVYDNLNRNLRKLNEIHADVNPDRVLDFTIEKKGTLNHDRLVLEKEDNEAYTVYLLSKNGFSYDEIIDHLQLKDSSRILEIRKKILRILGHDVGYSPLAWLVPEDTMRFTNIFRTETDYNLLQEEFNNIPSHRLDEIQSFKTLRLLLYSLPGHRIVNTKFAECAEILNNAGFFVGKRQKETSGVDGQSRIAFYYFVPESIFDKALAFLDETPLEFDFAYNIDKVAGPKFEGDISKLDLNNEEIFFSNLVEQVNKIMPPKFKYSMGTGTLLNYFNTFDVEIPFYLFAKTTQGNGSSYYVLNKQKWLFIAYLERLHEVALSEPHLLKKK